MLQFNPFALSGLLIVITFVPLLFLIFIKGKTLLTKIYGLHILSIFIWGIGSFLVGINRNPQYAEVIWKFACSTVIFIPVFFYHAVHLITDKKNPLFLYFTYFQAICILSLVPTNYLFSSYQLVFDSLFYTKATILWFIAFLLWVLIVSVAHFELLRFYRKSGAETRKQLSFVIFAGIGFIGGTSNFLPGFGINIYPYGNFLVPIHSFGIFYAILRHQFLGIEAIYKKGLSYSILFALILLLYLTIVVSFEKLIQHHWGYSSTLISILTAFFIGIVFIPLRNFIQSHIDKMFFLRDPIEIVKENELLHREVVQTEKLRLIATLAGGIAHEIRNPLTAIKTFTEFLPDKRNNDEFLEKYHVIVNKEIERINELTSQLLDLAKPIKPEFQPINCNKLINDLLTLIQNNLSKRLIKVVVEFEQSETLIPADSNQLKQAILNILLNAMDAMPTSGTLTLKTFVQDGYYIISIRDTGAGIDPHDLKHIFDPFFSKKETGTGLGLAITQKIIEQHKGIITASSEINTGTKFDIILPINNKARNDKL